VIAGGGTGGHVVPAIAIGRALVQLGHDPSTLLFVGSRRGIEVRMVPAAGFDLVALPGRGIARRVNFTNVASLAGLVAGSLRAMAVIGRARPAVVVVVGGYASVPAALAAIIMGVPVVVSEQNAVPGLANRLAGRFAKACAVAFPGTPLPRAVDTGNPVRAEIAGLERSDPARVEARRELGIAPQATVVAVVGGSLGARRINEAALALAQSWKSRSGVSIYHVVGERDWAEISARPVESEVGGLQYKRVRFEDRMDLLLCAADIFVSRAGATTVAELTAAGVASLLVPLGGSPGDHQSHNARVLSDAGAAVTLADSELDARTLAERLGGLLSDRSRLDEMAAAARALGRPDAALAVARLVERNARA
jgi:undecaprenyldiphospho-muramoylpentapeptide beta-N-acetylglucosaminyltransferase